MRPRFALNSPRHIPMVSLTAMELLTGDIHLIAS